MHAGFKVKHPALYCGGLHGADAGNVEDFGGVLEVIEEDAAPAMFDGFAQSFDGGGLVHGGQIGYDALGGGRSERGFDFAAVLRELGPGIGEAGAVG